MKVEECFRGLSVLLFITFVGQADSKQVKNILYKGILHDEYLFFCPFRFLESGTMLVGMSA